MRGTARGGGGREVAWFGLQGGCVLPRGRALRGRPAKTCVDAAGAHVCGGWGCAGLPGEWHWAAAKPQRTSAPALGPCPCPPARRLQELHDNVRLLAASATNTKLHGAPFRHMLFYGEPPPSSRRRPAAAAAARRTLHAPPPCPACMAAPASAQPSPLPLLPPPFRTPHGCDPPSPSHSTNINPTPTPIPRPTPSPHQALPARARPWPPSGWRAPAGWTMPS